MPRKLLRSGVVVLDEWHDAADVGADGGDEPLIVTFAEWQAAREQLVSRSGRLGVMLAPGDEVERLAPDLARLDLAGAIFASPAEGRGYTQGRLLRERFGFRGELRARGAIGRDQAFFLARCGFDALEMPETEIDAAAAALATFSAAYQPANDRGLAARLPPQVGRVRYG